MDSVPPDRQSFTLHIYKLTHMLMLHSDLFGQTGNVTKQPWEIDMIPFRIWQQVKWIWMFFPAGDEIAGFDYLLGVMREWFNNHPKLIIERHCQKIFAEELIILINICLREFHNSSKYINNKIIFTHLAGRVSLTSVLPVMCQEGSSFLTFIPKIHNFKEIQTPTCI